MSAQLTLGQIIKTAMESERRMWETWVSIMENPVDIEAAHRVYAEKWGHPPLTDMEKRQAIMNYVLDGIK